MKNIYPKGWFRCPMCDEWYDPGSERARVHEHPEPQSGPSRDAWLSSSLPYEEWTDKTEEGKKWLDIFPLNPSNYQNAADPPVSEARRNEMEKLIDSCFKLLMFTKHNEFPEPNTEGFFKLTQLLDDVETAMLIGGFVDNQSFKRTWSRPRRL